MNRRTFFKLMAAPHLSPPLAGEDSVRGCAIVFSEIGGSSW